MTPETTAAIAATATLPVMIAGFFCPPVWIAIIPLSVITAVAADPTTHQPSR